MLRSLPYLLLLTLSPSDPINCADNDTKPNAEAEVANYKADWFTRDIKITEPHSVLMWEGGSPHRRFFYLTWDGKKSYCEVTQVTTESAEGSTTTCRYQFRANETQVQMRRLVLPNEGDSKIGISFSTSQSRRVNGHYVRFVDFKTCQRYGAPDANQIDIYSNANGRHGACKVNQDRTQIACKQYDRKQQVTIDAKYDLPTRWKADWFAVHNSKAGALLLYFGDCPNGMCKEYSRVRLTAYGWDGQRYVGKEMNLRCSDVTKLSVDATDQDDDGVCMHAMCSDVENDETVLRHRRQCATGDSVA